jgi:rSAM/selenodomain-associated transferase 2
VTSVRQHLPGAAIVVVDGRSSDETAAIAAAAGAEVMASDRGRGRQCRAGAANVRSEWMLFLHADTSLPSNAREVIAGFTARPAASIATFRLRFDQSHFFLRACCWFTRFDSVFTRFGDQGILIRRTFYEQLGGFPDWPLFEDVALLQRARALTRIHSLPACVTTSARRFRDHGPLRQQMQNARLLLRYLLGASPEDLAREYRTGGPEPGRAIGETVER